MMNNNKKTSFGIRAKLLFAMLSLTVAVIFAFTYILISSQKGTLENELSRRTEMLKGNLLSRGKIVADNLARVTENHIASYNFSNIEVLLKRTVAKNAELEYAILMDSDRKAVFHTMKPELRQTVMVEAEDILAANLKNAGINEYIKDGQAYIEFVVPITVGIKFWGWLRLGFSQELLNKGIVKSKKEIADKVRNMAFKSIVIAIAFLFTGTGIIILISNRLLKPIMALTNSVREITKGNFIVSEDIKVYSKDEIGTLSIAFVDMTKTLQKSHSLLDEHRRTLEVKVEERTKELKKAYDNLKLSQEQLVESEKMASLGQLVAGIAHEVNTPIGIGVTTSTNFIDITKNIVSSYKNDEMTKDDLERFFETSSKSCELIYRNLLRTAELIKSFKMISADQVSHEKRKFNMASYLSDIISSLRPKLKKAEPEVSITCPANIVLNSYPGAIAQIITNFIINSLTHAFGDIKKYKIDIEVSTTNDELIILKYSDNGKGISEKNIKKIFDPFFSTMRGKGGTGLGLNIVYNIVTQTLKGGIKCNSTPGKGVTFIIEMPCEI